MEPDSATRLPRSPQDPENLRRMREKVLGHLEQEEQRAQAVIYGGPPPLPNPPEDPSPAPVYGGPPMRDGGTTTRRGVLWALIIAALAAIGALIAWLFKPRKILPASSQGPSGPPAAVYGGPALPRPQPQPSPIRPPRVHSGAIVTANGHLLSAVNGGGLGNSHSAPRGVALSTGSTTAGPFETFALVWVDQAAQKFALRTNDGHYVTAVNGGGIGGPDSSQFPIHTDSTRYGAQEKFTINVLPDGVHVTIGTPDGKHFVGAVNGGGVGGSNRIPIRTDASRIDEGAVFQLRTDLPAAEIPRTPAPVYGGPPNHGPR